MALAGAAGVDRPGSCCCTSPATHSRYRRLSSSSSLSDSEALALEDRPSLFGSPVAAAGPGLNCCAHSNIAAAKNVADNDKPAGQHKNRTETHVVHRFRSLL